MAVSAFGTPFPYAAQFTPWGSSIQGAQGLGINPYAFQQYAQNQPLMSAPLSSTIGSTGLGQPQLQQVIPLLQIVPQQLQHLQQLVSVQLQELQQLQQIVQVLPGQLQQIQQLVQSALQQSFQQPAQFQQPYGQSVGLGSFPSSTPWAFGPQAFGAQPGHVM